MQGAVEEAIETCIRQDILKDFLMEQKAEVIAMSIYEYNEEYVKKTLFEDGYDAGKTEGIEIGNMQMLVNSVDSAMKNFNMDLECACKGLGISVTDYENAKEKLK